MALETSMTDNSLIDRVLQKYVSNDPNAVGKVRAAGFVVKTRDGDTIYSNAAGKLSFKDDSPPFTVDSVCTVASCTKLATAVAVMQLVERGMVGLDDDLGNLDPGLANKDVLIDFKEDGSPNLTKASVPITLRRLLTHSSGFTYEYFHEPILKWSEFVGREVDSRSNTDEGYNFPLLFDPGKGWAYGVGTDLAGRIIQRLTNLSLEEYMQKNIFEPLGMKSTTFNLSKHPEMVSNLATMWFRYSNDASLEPRKERLQVEEKITARGGSGLYCSNEDYVKLLLALISYDRRILKPESIKELCRPQLENPKYLQEFSEGEYHDATFPEFPIGLKLDYSLGGCVNLEDIPRRRREGTLTWTGSTGPRWFIDFKTGIVAALFIQVFPFEDPAAVDLYNDIEEALYQSLGPKCML